VVDVLAEKVEQEPVAHGSLLHHQLHTLRLDPGPGGKGAGRRNLLSVAELEEVCSESSGDT
jgi:hypothetical protein